MSSVVLVSSCGEADELRRGETDLCAVRLLEITLIAVSGYSEEIIWYIMGKSG